MLVASLRTRKECLLKSILIAAIAVTLATATAQTPSAAAQTADRDRSPHLVPPRNPAVCAHQSQSPFRPDGAPLAWAFNGSTAPSCILPASRPRLAPKRRRPRPLARHHPEPRATMLRRLCRLASRLVARWQAARLPLLLQWRRRFVHSDAQQNIFVWTLATNSIKQVSHLRGEISDLQWSPDGKSIAFLFVENATRHAGALDAMKPWNGVYGEDAWRRGFNVVVTRMKGGNIAVRIFRLVPPDELRTLLVSRLHDTSLPGHPTRRTCFCGRATAWRRQLVGGQALSRVAMPALVTATSAETYEQPKFVFDPTTTPGPLHGLQIAVPRFSPDGKQIAFIGGLMSDQGSTGGDIYLIPATGLKPGEEPKDVTPNRPASPACIAWLDDHDLGISEHVGGSCRITTLDLHTTPGVTATMPRISLTLPETIIAGFDVDERLHVATAQRRMIRQSFDHPPEVWAGPIDDLKQITHLNDSLKPAWGKAESIDYTNEGFTFRAGCSIPPAEPNARPKEISAHRQRPRRPILPLRRAGPPRLRPGSLFRAGLLRLHAQSARQLRPGREVHPGQHHPAAPAHQNFGPWRRLDRCTAKTERERELTFSSRRPPVHTFPAKI